MYFDQLSGVAHTQKKKCQEMQNKYFNQLLGGLLTWPNQDDQKCLCNLTENAKDCKRYVFLTLKLTEKHAFKNDTYTGKIYSLV